MVGSVADSFEAPQAIYSGEPVRRRQRPSFQRPNQNSRLRPPRSTRGVHAREIFLSTNSTPSKVDTDESVLSDRVSFHGLGLDQWILDVLDSIGFERPTEIQDRVIRPALDGLDIIGLAETGSGKTAAFCLPLLQDIEPGEDFAALILCPTREIALQTHAFLELFSPQGRASKKGMSSVCLIGGVAIGPQITDLKRGPEIIVATPGRMLDHIERRTVRVDDVFELVLDEADHMLDLGFLPQIQRILNRLPGEDRRTMLFSATMPPPIEKLASRFLTDPVRIDVLPKGRAARGIEHRLYLVDEENKKPCIHALLKQVDGTTLVFTRRKSDAEWLSALLRKEGHPVARIHSDRSQSNRVRALEGFREGTHRILVATDIAARGIDIPGIDHVVNFDMPETVEDYIHRAGRTARGDNVGIVSSIGTWLDKGKVRSIESAIGQDLTRHEAEGVPPWVERAGRLDRRRRSPLRR